MNILCVNKYYYPRGGSEVVFFNQIELLERNGHHTLHFSMNDEKNELTGYSKYFIDNVDYSHRGPFKLIKNTVNLLYSKEAIRKINLLLDNEKVDIVHLHNIYHQISPSIITAIKARDIPIVMTLHDYKMVCSIYTLYNGKRICEDCSGGKYWAVVLNDCRKSLIHNLVLSAEMIFHHKILDIYKGVDLFLSPSNFLKNKLKEMGFNGPIKVLNNFINTDSYKPSFHITNGHFVYFGRLSFEKGLLTLIKAVKGLPIKLHIIGDGPIRGQLETLISSEKISNVEILGYMKGEALTKEIGSSIAVVVPSEWYENYPMSILEAFALGKPVIGSKLGGIPELIKPYETGLTFTAGRIDELRNCILWFIRNPEKGLEMGVKARRFVVHNMNPQKYYNELISIYEEVIKTNKNKER
jgi:glycosyltransferase involved in cell wall biosynthesis